MTILFCTFAYNMNKGRKETLTTRIISATFVTVSISIVISR